MKDFKIQYTKGSGPGGQHKNKVETCVVVTHIPTGFQERSQDTRSRSQNLKLALERVTNRVNAEVERLAVEKRCNMRNEQIVHKKTLRTYNYARNEVKDHRTGKRANLKKVLDGNIDLIR